MSTAVFPALVGLGWSVPRANDWASVKSLSVSGKQVSSSRWSFPRYTWTVLYNVLRIGNVDGTIYDEMQTLFGFYNQRAGAFDSFLYKDTYDNSVTGQTLGSGDGSNTQFQLIRSFNGFVPEPVYAPNVLLPFHVYLNGSLVDPVSYVVAQWDDPTYPPGTINFTTAPGLNVVVSATFSFYWPVRFVEDECLFSKFLDGRYKVDRLAFQTIK